LTKIYDFIRIKGGCSMKMNKRGVTLIELIVVFVIIAIGAVLMVPNMGAWLPNYRLRSATRDMVSTMRVAQMRAVSNNLDHRVSFTPGTGDAGSYVLERNTGGVWVAEGGSKTLPTGIKLTTNFPGSRVVFKPNSQVEQGGKVVLEYPPKMSSRTINVSLSTGRIAIE
jgi:prepilin-type N-terminal cleavage/methylation domain-containing protein